MVLLKSCLRAGGSLHRAPVWGLCGTGLETDFGGTRASDSDLKGGISLLKEECFILQH